VELGPYKMKGVLVLHVSAWSEGDKKEPGLRAMYEVLHPGPISLSLAAALFRAMVKMDGILTSLETDEEARRRALA